MAKKDAFSSDFSGCERTRLFSHVAAPQIASTSHPFRVDLEHLKYDFCRINQHTLCTDVLPAFPLDRGINFIRRYFLRGLIHDGM
jgi:hypothetical protein